MISAKAYDQCRPGGCQNSTYHLVSPPPGAKGFDGKNDADNTFFNVRSLSLWRRASFEDERVVGRFPNSVVIILVEDMSWHVVLTEKSPVYFTVARGLVIIAVCAIGVIGVSTLSSLDISF